MDGVSSARRASAGGRVGRAASGGGGGLRGGKRPRALPSHGGRLPDAHGGSHGGEGLRGTGKMGPGSRLRPPGRGAGKGRGSGEKGVCVGHQRTDQEGRGEDDGALRFRGRGGGSRGSDREPAGASHAPFAGGEIRRALPGGEAGAEHGGFQRSRAFRPGGADRGGGGRKTPRPGGRPAGGTF